MRSNKLFLNENKTELIKFRSPWKHLLREPDIRINNCKFKLDSHIKQLGILIINEVLSWNKQIDNICTMLATESRSEMFGPQAYNFIKKRYSGAGVFL